MDEDCKDTGDVVLDTGYLIGDSGQFPIVSGIRNQVINKLP